MAYSVDTHHQTRRFGEGFPRTGGGEDVDFCIRLGADVYCKKPLLLHPDSTSECCCGERPHEIWSSVRAVIRQTCLRFNNHAGVAAAGVDHPWWPGGRLGALQHVFGW